MIELSHRVQQVKPSPTLSITARAAELRDSGRQVLSLSVGEPEFPTPSHIREAAIAAIDAGFTRYTAVAGIPELRLAICEKFRRDNGLEYTPEQVLVSAGGKQCIYNLLQAMINPKDEVIIPAPYWVSYPDMVKLAEGRPVIVETRVEDGFRLRAEQLEEAITPRTRLLFINSPSNPTGMCYSSEDLATLGEVLRRHPHVAIATDDMYEKIIFDQRTFVTFAQVNPDLKERTITLNGVSKAYCMTGWRIGYCAGPTHLIKAMGKIQGQSTSNPNAIAQKAAIAALQGPTDDLDLMVATYAARREWLVSELNAIDGIDCLLPEGAFYVFPSFKKWLGRKTPAGQEIKDDVQLCEWLLEQAGVALVPGTAFGAPGHVRISYAVSQETLEDAVSRIRHALQGLVA